MIIKSRSPTMRHVSRTHRVALDCQHQLADLLTKSTFTRDEWNNLLHLFNISHFSSTCCAQKSSLISFPKKMAKKMQEQKRRRQDCGKIKAHNNEFDVNCLDKFLIREPSVCVEKARGYSKHLQGNPTRGQEEIKNPTRRRVPKEG